MYARTSGEHELTFDFAMGLLNDNLLFVDRETRSIWSQLDGKAISGPLKNAPLKMIPALQTTWQHWRELHPKTRVLVMEEEGRPYVYRNRRPGGPRPKKRQLTHDTSALGLALVLADKPVFFPFSELDKVKTPMRFTRGGATITINYRKDALTAWAEDQDGTLLPAVLAYSFGWKDFHPDTEIFSATSGVKQHEAN